MTEIPEPIFSADEFERSLHQLAESIAFPETPDFVSAFRRDVSIQAAQVRWRHRRVVQIGIAAALVLLLIAGGVAVIPGARNAVADWFDIPGIRLLVDDESPTVTPEPPAALSERYGPPVTLQQAGVAVDFPILLPAYPDVPGERAIYLTNGETPVVLVAYPAPATLPDAAQSGAGLLRVEFRSSSDAVWGMKRAGDMNDIEVVRINGVEALWIGGTHQLTIVPAQTDATPDIRQSANVLAWNVNGVTYRIEADLPQETMIAIAESMKPAT